MKSTIWFLFGFCFMVLVSLLLGSCSAPAEFTMISADDMESSDPTVHPSLRVSAYASSSDKTMVPLGVSVGTRAVLLGVYTIKNEATHIEVVRSFTVKSATGKNTFARIGYAWGESPEEILDATVPSIQSYATFAPDATRARMPPGSMRTLRLFGVTSKVGGTPVNIQSGEIAVLELVSLVGLGNVPATLEGSLIGPTYVLRRSQPLVLSYPATDASLRADRLYLFSWGVRADSAGDLSIKQFALRLDLTNVEACEFQLRRNTRLVSPYEVRVLSLTSGADDLAKGCARTSTELSVAFANEEFVRAGTETVFTLRAKLTPLGKGASVMTRFLRSSLVDARTMELACVGKRALRLGSSEGAVPAILWSDLSAQPHSDVPCRSSKDWIGDAFVADLNMSQLLR